MLILLALIPLIFGEPTAKVRIGIPGLKFLANEAQDYVDQVAHQFDIADIIDESVEATVTNITLTNFHSPKFEVRLDGGVSLRTTSGQATIDADWTKTWMSIYNEGHLTANVNGINTIMALSVFVRDGVPVLKLHKCLAHIGTVSLDITGSIAATIANTFFRSRIEDALANLLEQKICNNSVVLVEQALNQRLYNLARNSTITKDKLIGARFIAKSPLLHPNYLEVALDVVAKFKGYECQPVLSEKIRDDHGYEYMASMWISESIANCLFDSMHKSGYLARYIDGDAEGELRKETKEMLKTSCEHMCFGYFLPTLPLMYPNRDIGVFIRSSTAPRVTVERSGATIEAATILDLHLLPIPGTFVTGRQFIGRLLLNTSTKVDAHIDRGILRGDVRDTRATMEVLDSRFGVAPLENLETLGSFLATMAEFYAHKYAIQGFAFPELRNVGIARTSVLSFLDGVVALHVNFEKVD